MIRLERAALTYPGPPPVPALRPTNLTVHRGEYVSIVGPSGSGKSTLLNILGLLDRPTEGKFLLDGVDTGALGDRERTALRGLRIGFVFQAFHLLARRTAVENVALAQLYRATPAQQRRHDAREALERVGLAHRLNTEPARLSGGERQRVAIARALAAQPALLLCDEPTGNLDSANAATVLQLLDDLWHAGMTVLVITHDPTVADQAPRRIIIRDGVVTG
ncbi:ABC transporter ATP-binding protein [Micromonospora sp. NPDC048170]|uniref:ABC transporter ATP-binding protein n=1 Tax=Micromonospora sp. NPDC048170 TaxID=3154819 RepID=UPI0033C0D759